ncbi:helix-turn-helix domain-containing protein [Actinosynnema sp. CS-041913]|uniref:helix-turn-helix domain-containing protein n=1 Tax=Actinosynnema sp. CS-041913 TaxID=3239917 RepID=UPI003D8AF688
MAGTLEGNATINVDQEELTAGASAATGHGHHREVIMRSGAATLTRSQGWRSIGVVSGFVLKLSRQAAGLTQEQLAALLGVDVTTVQGWESGRRPMSAIGTGEFIRIGARLVRAGAPPSTGRYLRLAIEADLVLSTGVEAGPGWVDPNLHPLAAGVHRKDLTNLITWPFTRSAPPHLLEFAPSRPRRGPAPTYPSLGAVEQARFFDHLQLVADRSRNTPESLLRRQAVYLLGFDRRGHVVDWLRDEWSRAGRKALRPGDITSLLEARSASVALALTGDGSHLHDFVAKTTGTEAELANLNYWAHWLGESSGTQTDDSFMLEHDKQGWSGARLLSHLTSRLDPHSPHLPLNLHTLQALAASRPALLKGEPKIKKTLEQALTRLASSGTLTQLGSNQVTMLNYALRISDH